MKITNFWDGVPTKKEFETAMAVILQDINAGTNLGSPQAVKIALQYANARYSTRTAKSPLPWLKLALSKHSDSRYSLQSILFDEKTGWAFATDGHRIHVAKTGGPVGLSREFKTFNSKTKSYERGEVPELAKMLGVRPCGYTADVGMEILSESQGSLKIVLLGQEFWVNAKYYREATQILTKPWQVWAAPGQPIIFEGDQYLAAIMPQSKGVV